MKTIAFFSEKGGVGKSSFSIMYTSWLKKHGVKTGLVDFNDRVQKYRNNEIRNRNAIIAQNPEKGIKPFMSKDAWPIHTVMQKELYEYERGGSKFPCYQALYDQLLFKEMKDADVVVVDFPGSITGKEFPQCYNGKLISYIAMPTERDPMTLDSTNKMHAIFKKMQNDPFYKDNYCVFMNKAQLGLNNMRSVYFKLMKRLVDAGIPMLPDMISYTERMSTIEKVDIFRSTFGYPDFDAPEYEKVSDLGMGNLFIDITRELRSRPELPDTGVSDLSFVDALRKKDDGRQFKGSAFPQYEI